jgi:eukaryotic-like serine/threonine-protein kinase
MDILFCCRIMCLGRLSSFKLVAIGSCMTISPFSLEDIKKLFPQFEIVKRVGQGSFKVVYEVFNDSQHMALKVLHGELDFTRLIRETDAMRIVQSPYVAKLYEFQVKRSSEISIAYILEEYIEGEELNSILDRGKIYSPKESVLFLEGALKGLEACWEKRIVHRDIKPANIMVRKDETPVIVDFGLSRHLDLTSLTPTDNIGVIGTPLFAPPEVLRYRKNDIDSKTDIYSLGVTLYMMLTGEHPYLDLKNLRNVTMNDLLYNPIKPPNEIIPHIPDSLSRFIMRMINRNRVDRPKDATHALSRLAQVKRDL